MFQIMSQWIDEYFGNRQALALLFLNFLILALTLIFAKLFTPIMISLVLAFLMQGPINTLSQYISYKKSCLTIFVIFITLTTLVFMTLIPVLWDQLILLVQEAPSILLALKKASHSLFNHLDYYSPQFFDQILINAQSDITRFSKSFVQMSVTSIPSIIVLLVYSVLIPLIMVFLNLDKDKISEYLVSYFPEEKAQLQIIFHEVLLQLSNYLRGKIYEILIVGVASFLTFKLLSLKYAFLLGTLVGLSVLIPYVGATLVTFPVVFVAYFQFGFDGNFTTIIIAYTIIQVLDGNVVVPILFSEAVSLHPLVIILAVLIFGYLGGIWGIFFAIPLAAILNAYVNHWPKTSLVS